MIFCLYWKDMIIYIDIIGLVAPEYTKLHILTAEKLRRSIIFNDLIVNMSQSE